MERIHNITICFYHWFHVPSQEYRGRIEISRNLRSSPDDVFLDEYAVSVRCYRMYSLRRPWVNFFLMENSYKTLNDSIDEFVGTGITVDVIAKFLETYNLHLKLGWAIRTGTEDIIEQLGKRKKEKQNKLLMLITKLPIDILKLIKEFVIINADVDIIDNIKKYLS